MANLIVSKFAAAGFGRIQQITAVANAWKESNLTAVPKPANTAREFSVGLFQLNMKGGGLGAGHSQPELEDPGKNTDIIIAVCKKVPDFVRAQTLRAAVTAFVQSVENPAHQPEEIEDRLNKANTLAA